MDDEQFRQLLQYLRLSWKGYRKVRKGVKKRIQRHMRQMGCQYMEAYLIELEKSDETKDECERLMTVSISRFFRDQILWKILQKDVLPNLIKKHREKINVWVAGCASGEEVYSLNILWNDLAISNDYLPKLEIIATDMNPACLERAKAGIYSPSSLKEVPEHFRSLFFQALPGKNLYAVDPSLKSNIIWQIHHLLNDPPKSLFHLIFLRNNLLTYYEDKLKKTAIIKITECLSLGGFLIIGSHENLPFETPDLLPSYSLSYVLKKG